ARFGRCYWPARPRGRWVAYSGIRANWRFGSQISCRGESQGAAERVGRHESDGERRARRDPAVAVQARPDGRVGDLQASPAGVVVDDDRVEPIPDAVLELARL